MKVAILRGINVGGRRKVLMQELRSICEDLEWQRVATYIQSGNVIFEATGDHHALESALEEALHAKYGFDVPVIVRSAVELETCLTNNPFATSDVDSKCLHVTFLKDKPNQEQIDRVLAIDAGPDRLVIKGQTAYIYCAGKYHQSKLTNNHLERKLKVGATTRNWKTVNKLVALSKI